VRVLKLLAACLILAPIVLASAKPVSAPCAPQPRVVEPLMIAWIDCRSETLVLLNGSSRDMDLTGYWLENRLEQRFVFQRTAWNPECCILKAHDVLRVHSGKGNLKHAGGPRDLHWLNADGVPSDMKIWGDRSGVAVLYNSENELVAHYEYGR
jgi:hypothetical protein